MHARIFLFILRRSFALARKNPLYFKGAIVALIQTRSLGQKESECALEVFESDFTLLAILKKQPPPPQETKPAGAHDAEAERGTGEYALEEVRLDAWGQGGDGGGILSLELAYQHGH